MAMVTRRSFISKSAATAAAVVVSPAMLSRPFGKGPDSPLAGKKVLLVWGGYMPHEPDNCRDKFIPWIRSQGAEVIVPDTLDLYVSYDFKNDFDLIVQTSLGAW